MLFDHSEALLFRLLLPLRLASSLMLMTTLLFVCNAFNTLVNSAVVQNSPWVLDPLNMNSEEEGHG